LKLYRDYAVLAFGQVGARVLGLLAFGWLARVLAPESYGAVEYVIGLALLGGYVVDGGSNLVAVRRAGQRLTALPQLGSQMLLVRLVLCAIAVPIVALAGSWTLSASIPQGLVWLFAGSLLLAPLRHEWMFQAVGRNADIARSQIVRAGVFAALVWVWVRGIGDIVAVGWAEIASIGALTAYCVYVQHTRITPFRWARALEGFAPLMRESAAAGLTNALWAMSQYAPLIMIGALIGGVQTAWFAAAARIVGALLVVPYVYHFGLYPAVVRALPRKEELGELLQRSCRVTAWGGVFLAVAVTLFSRALIVGILGARVEPAAPILQIMVWIVPAALCAGHAISALAADGAQTRLLWTRLLVLGVIVGVGLIAGAQLGAIGYAVAALAGTVALWVIAHVFAARRRLPPPAFSLVLKPAALAAVALVAARLTDSGPWLSLMWLAGYALSAPLFDRMLLQDLSQLGRSPSGSAPSPGANGASTLPDVSGFE
jgi:O-antigen/teichoic acid export membrane protein